MSASTEDTSASDSAPEASSAPTTCEYNNSVTDFLKCNKDKFTTTQLVGGGIGVTMLIFGVAFGIIWFVRRKKALPKEKKKDVEKRKSDDEESDDEGDISDDEEEEEKREYKKDQKSPSATSGPAARARAAQQASIDQRQLESQKAPPRPPRTEETLGHDLNPHNPSSRASSRSGSPTGSSPVRQLSLTNPDSRRNTRVGPALSRPPSSVSKPERRPQTAYQTQTRQPAVSSGLRPQDPRTARASSYVPQSGDQRPSQATAPRAHSVHPPSNPVRSSSRSSSVYSTMSRQNSYQDVPLPPLPSDANTRARSDSVYSTASRRNSVTQQDAPPGYTSSRETSPKMKAQAPPKLVHSRPGVSRQSTAASVQSGLMYEDASEEIEEVKMPPRRMPRKQEAIAESPLPYDR